MDQSSFVSNSGNTFQQDSSSSLSSSFLIGYTSQRLERKQEGQCKGQKQQNLSVDLDLLKKYPILLQEVMKIFGNRSNNSQLQKLCAQYLKEKPSIIQNETQQKTLECLNKVKKQLLQLQDGLNKYQQKNDKSASEYGNVCRANKFKKHQLMMLKDFIKQMMLDPNSNPFVNSIPQYKTSLNKIIKKILLEEIGSLSSSSVKDQKGKKSKQQIQALIKRRQNQLKQLQQENNQIECILNFQELQISRLKQVIRQCRRQRGQIVDQKDQILDDIKLKITIIPELIDNIINHRSEQKQMLQQIGKPLEQYKNEIIQLTNQNQSIKQQLKIQTIIKSQKINKCALLQKKVTQITQEYNKFTKLTYQFDDSQTDLKVNYQEFLLQTYQLQQNKLKTQKLQQNHLRITQPLTDNNPKKAKKIVVKNKPIGFPQQYFPSIKNYKQLINWIILFWILALVLIFTRKSLIKHEIWPNQILSIDLPDQPDLPKQKVVVSHHQRKKKIETGQEINKTDRLQSGDNEIQILLDSRKSIHIKQYSYDQPMLKDQSILQQGFKQGYSNIIEDSL